MYTRNANIMKIIRLHVLIYIKVKLLCIIFSQCNFQRLCARCLPPVREQCIQHTPKLFESTFFLPRSSRAFTSLLIQINFSSCFIFLFGIALLLLPPLLFCLIGTTVVVCRCLLHFSFTSSYMSQSQGLSWWFFLPERVLSRLVLSN